MYNLVSGAGSVLDSLGSLHFGSPGGTGALTITNGGEATTSGFGAGKDILQGSTPLTHGTITVRDTDSTLASGNNIVIGDLGTGVLNVTDDGKATATGSVSIGRGTSGIGTVTISGENSRLEAGVLDVGGFGTGTLSITDGGKATSLGAITIGAESSSNGSVLVGKNSSLVASNDISVGMLGGAIGTLAGTGLVQASNSVKVSDGSVISPGDVAGEIGTLTIESQMLQMNNDSTLRVDTGPDGTADKIVVTGGDAQLNDVTIDLTSLNNVTNIPIIQANTAQINGFPTVTLNGVSFAALADRLPMSTTTAFAQDGKILLNTNFNNAQSAQNTWTGANGDTWDMISSKWSHPTNKFLAGDWVNFDDALFSSGTVNVAGGGVTASQMDVSGGNWTFNGDILVRADTWVGTPLPTAPDGKLHITNNALVTLNGNNTFTGGIDIDYGYLTLQSGTSSGTAAIANNDRLMLNYATNGVFRNSVSGSGFLYHNGMNVTTLTGTNSYFGPTLVNNGTLQAGGTNVFSPNSFHHLSSGTVLDLNYFDQSISALSGAAGSEVRLGDATLTINEGSTGDFQGTFFGNGRIVKSGSLQLYLTEDSSSSFTGEFSLLGGDVILRGGKLGGTFSQASGTSLITNSGAAIGLSEVRPASRPEFRHLKENNPTQERGGGVKFWRA